VISFFFTLARAYAFPEVLRDVNFYQGQMAIENLPLGDILDASGSRYYHYEGKETLDKCKPASWVLMA